MSGERRTFEINEFVELITDQPELLSKLDPLGIPEINEKNFAIKEGRVRGLSRLYRYDDCTLKFDGEVADIGVKVAVRKLTINMKYSIWALFFWITGHATVSVSDLAVRMDVSAKEEVVLDSFKIHKLGKYEIEKITGFSFVFNWLLKLVTNAVAKKFRSEIIGAMENILKTSIKKLLNAYQETISSYIPTAMKCLSYVVSLADSVSPHTYELYKVLELILDWSFLTTAKLGLYQENLGFSISYGT